MSQQILFRNFELLEPSFGELRDGYELLVEGDSVKELSDRPIKAAEADVIDCGKRTLMPGLIDCHVHAIHSEVNVRFMEMLPLTLVTARAATRLRAMLDRGFTTVRDTGGADWGIKTAIETGHITGPRLYIAGQSIGPTGGHSDSRRRTNPGGECVCCNGLQFKSAIADGVDEVRKCAREQMRQGADRGGGADNLGRRQHLRTQREFLRLRHLQLAEQIGAVGDRHAVALADFERLQGTVDDEVVLGQHVRIHAVFGGMLLHLEIGHEVGDQEHALLGHQPGGRIVDQIAVLDGPHPGIGGARDGLRRIGVGTDITAKRVRLLNGCLYLVHRELQAVERIVDRKSVV